MRVEADDKEEAMMRMGASPRSDADGKGRRSILSKMRHSNAHIFNAKKAPIRGRRDQIKADLNQDLSNVDGGDSVQRPLSLAEVERNVLTHFKLKEREQHSFEGISKMSRAASRGFSRSKSTGKDGGKWGALLGS